MDFQFGKENRFLKDASLTSIRIEDFCDMKEFDRMMKNWAESTGLATVAIDNNGEYISGYYNFTDFCERLTRQSPEGLRRCIECDKRSTGIYLCHAGLVDFATPITLEDGTMLGSIVGGQVLPLAPDEARFRALARELGIDEDTYISALRKVNVRSQKAIKASADLLGNVINMFVRTSYAAWLNTTSLVRRAHIISSLSRIYFCTYYINADADSYMELDATESLHAYAVRCPSASGLIRETCRIYVLPEYAQRYQDFTDLTTLKKRMNGGESLTMEFACQRIGWCRGIFIRVEHEDEPGFHVVYAIQSIQKEKENDLAVRRMLEKAAEDANLANRAKTEFLTRMSHDIRTPLNGIIGMNYLAMEETPSPKVKEYLGKVDTSSKFLLTLINDILDMSRAESGRIELHPEPYSLAEFNEYIEAVITPLCTQKRLQFTVNEPQKELEVPVIDKARINQILFNILFNAVKYTPAGGSIRYDIRASILQPGRMEIVHEVRDTGIGMSAEFQKRMFEPFTRENPDTDSRGGSGLGLAIVRRLVDLMGGSIAVQSAPGQGTDITLTFHSDSVKAAEAAAENHRTAVCSGMPELAGKRLLLCEDNALNTEIACELLKSCGAAVDTAADGRIGLDLFQRQAPGTYAAILMDMRMPVMNGVDATRAIRALNRPDAKTVPIIAMTANAFEEDVHTCMEAGMDAFLAKPVDPEKMLQTIADSIRG